MRRRPILWMLAALVALSVPVATSQSAGQGGGDARQEIQETPGTPITFYGRVWNVGDTNPMPMNTQFPWGEEDYSIGSNANCNFPQAVVGAGATDGSECGWHMYWFTTPGFIQIKSSNEFGNDYGKLHNERGQTKDIYLDTSMQPTSTLYTSSDGHGYAVAACATGICWNWDPGYQPAWAVESYVWHTQLEGAHHGDASTEPDVGKVAARAEDVTLVAHGKWGPQEAWSMDATIPHPAADGTVNEHFAEMEWDPDFVASGGIIPKEHDIIVEFWWANENDAGQKYTIAQFTYNMNSGEDFPNNVVLPVRNPLDVELVFPRFVHDKLAILSILNTPWGSYDIDLESIELVIEDAAGNVVTPEPDGLQRFLDVSVAHSGHYRPINITWVWDYQAEDLAPGTYTATVKAVNFQHSAEAATEATFTITAEGTGGKTEAGLSGLLSFSEQQFESFDEGAQQASGGGQQAAPESAPDDDESEASPGAPVAVALFAVAAVAWAARRRA